jgi:hypothetical protein
MMFTGDTSTRMDKSVERSHDSRHPHRARRRALERVG